ncbi:molecular chaperone HscC [Asaia siamensis]|uniref:Molecular chaperone HscC n=1 Tax=Asaia siamensis TaxID=110479 RepID=A0ABQ1MEB2_9PROT|nr:heat shock protein 70 [Asaia siamensis NRIC 0323]GGC39338.1 molecular chaperone HscC [Asaia siamensis]
MAAARIAGLEALRLVNEPTAAALAFGLESRDEGQFLVLDLGGGTFDVSLLNKFEGIMEIRASCGDSNLGGNDFRDLIAALFLADQRIEASSLSPESYAQLIRAAESLKQALTTQDIAQERFHIASEPVEWTLSRERFEENATPLLTRLRAPVVRVMSDTSAEAAEIDEIILVGGASRMPLVRALVTRLFHRFPLAHPRPDHLIGLGATVQAGLVQRDSALEDLMMTDVCPFTLGTSTQDGHTHENIMSVIIERNSIIPISRTRHYVPLVDGQAHILFDILQGENIRPEMNVTLGDVFVALPTGITRKDRVSVCFTYDVSGALEVEILVEKTGALTRKIFAGQSGLSPEDIEKRFVALQQIKLAPRDQIANHALVARAERLYAESVGERRDLIGNELMRFLARVGKVPLREVAETRAQFGAWLDAMERNLPFA